MELTAQDRSVFEGLEKRKLDRHGECESCCGTGRSENLGCGHCLGQGILLTTEEYALLLRLAGLEDFAPDEVLDAEYLI